MTPQNPHLELLNEEADRLPEHAPETARELDLLHAAGLEFAKASPWMPNTRRSSTFSDRWKNLKKSFNWLLPKIHTPLPPATETSVPDDIRWLHENSRLIEIEFFGLSEPFKEFAQVPHVRDGRGTVVPRVGAIAQNFLINNNYEFSEQALTAFIEGFQDNTPLEKKELSALVPALKLVLLEEISNRATAALRDKTLTVTSPGYGVGVCMKSLRDLGQTSWKDVLEPLIRFDRVLRQDPAGAYPLMDSESRELYRRKLAEFAERSDFTEIEVAQQAVALAREAQEHPDANSRISTRRSHVGFYLLDDGVPLLHDRIAFRPSFRQRVQAFLLSHPDEFYLPGIEILTFAIMSGIVLLLTDPVSSPGLVLLAMLALLLPSSQAAVQIMNYLATSLLPAQILPKLDFSEGIPDEFPALVAVPTLLLSEQQVRRLVDDLEVRFLGNHDRNLHFALLSDLPDSAERPTEENSLVKLCAELIRELNDKYSVQNMGSFVFLHRHRVYNPREKVWMGWERKRGKLMDLNKLLCGEYDSFPVKEGNLAVLNRIRYVITLDSDTELPRGSAHRMIGTMAHPLNQAIIDPEKNIVVAGYGILQPRVGVSVQSAVRSRLAAIYSGETGFDIYTRAISDVYQDLYGEAIFAGKGIYEVETLLHVLDFRFPRNALLSHDLIEGAYARAGLASDIEVIEDYPSHYSAYNRRKHRWLRGDWQITAWLFQRVPDESGKKVANPISLSSQWKILDNLRRSLVEPATLVLLVLGWLVLPGSPIAWTIATVVILFLPSWCRVVFELIRAAIDGKSEIARDAFEALYAATVTVLLSLVFTAHQGLVALDAVVRTLVRRFVTGQRLLQWETAAEAELGTTRRTPVDIYLDWTPALAFAIGLLVWLVRPRAFDAALPILLLWASSKLLSVWLNRPPRPLRHEVSEKDRVFLRQTALRTWRYFSDFSTAEHNWLIPDNVQEQPWFVAPRVSPTNVGMLLNARQVAREFGYLTVPEFAEQTVRTLDTVVRMPKFRGHLYNWYDTRTLDPVAPLFASSVDSGNLVASLWTLQQGALDRLRQPLFSPALAEGILDHVSTLVMLHAVRRRTASEISSKLKAQGFALRHADGENVWLQNLLTIAEVPLAKRAPAESRRGDDIRWFSGQVRARLAAIKQTATNYCPWLLPEFAPLRRDASLNLRSADNLPLWQLAGFIETLSQSLKSSQSSNGEGALRHQLLSLLLQARANVERLIEDLRGIAVSAGKLAAEMDFRFLLNRRRKLLSIGYDAGLKQLHDACYDLLASEARMGVFVGIAKDDLQQECWFQLGRVHTTSEGTQVLVSWTGTMFEYLMPSLWMRSFPETIVDRSRQAAVRAQQAYTAAQRIPWGISESAYAARNDAGHYHYHAFGVPSLALHREKAERLVISPYSTFLALSVDPTGALRNLREMARKGWCGAYGFYEAADFTSNERTWRGRRHEIVRCSMAHHQGMSLLSIANFLLNDIVQDWFHCHPRVQATELLLHEKPVAHVRPLRAGYGTAAA